MPQFRQMGGGAIRLYPLSDPRLHLTGGVDNGRANAPNYCIIAGIYDTCAS